MSIQNLIASGSLLIHSEKSTQSTSDLTTLLRSRLSQYRARAGLPSQHENQETLEDVQIATAKEALAVVERVQRILDDEDRTRLAQMPSTSQEKVRDDGPGEIPSIGTRDITHMRTLLSISFKWGTEPLLARVQAAWPLSRTAASYSASKITDLGDAASDYESLRSMTLRLYTLLFPDGAKGTVPQTLISSTLLSRHTTNLLRPALALGWIPKSASASTPIVDDLRTMTMRLLSILPPSQTIGSLGGVLSGNSLPALHVQKACKSIMSRQLLRPDGVRGLCAVVFGEDDVAGENAPLEKLEQFSRVLATVPANMPEQEYLTVIVPRLFALLKQGVHPAHRRAAAFAVSRMLTMNYLTTGILSALLHDPFLQPTASVALNGTQSPSEAILTIQALLMNADPAPTTISLLLSPVIPQLYAILATSDRLKAGDPSVRESVRGLLHTWGRLVGAEEAVAVLWACVNDQGGIWTVDISGVVRRIEKTEQEPTLALLTPQDLKRAQESGEFDADANFLGLRPDPVHFVRFVKTLDRADISSEIFVRLLEIYRTSRATEESDSLKTLMYLQLIVQMQAQLADASSSANILKNPEHIFSFIKHALDSAIVNVFQPNRTHRAEKSGLNLEDLRIINDDLDDGEELQLSSDSDDEDDASRAGGAAADDEMTVTALDLLLSILEADSSISALTTPLLSDTLGQVEQLTKHQSEAIRSLARESRMVLTVRLATTSTITSSTGAQKDADGVAQVYQKALKLLQDPILPVRAHGLLLLRELVTPPRKPSTLLSDLQPLLPAILDIFLQSVQDDDSYIFLNAVQGLSALVASFGKEILKSLVVVYTKDINVIAEANTTQAEIDTRLRVGEALGQVIQRCGDTLPDYANLLVPPLFAVVRANHLSTALRTSALSLLGQCADTSDLALLPYAVDLTDAMLQLLQLESVRSPRRPGSDDGTGPAPTMEDNPIANNAKLPPFRRASLHFLGHLIRAYTRRAYEDPMATTSSPSFPTERAITTLAYVAATDVDDVVRVMAREAAEAVQALDQARLGF